MMSLRARNIMNKSFKTLVNILHPVYSYVMAFVILTVKLVFINLQYDPGVAEVCIIEIHYLST